MKEARAVLRGRVRQQCRLATRQNGIAQVVSIRASLRQRGEPPFHFGESQAVTFQSAPHFGSEANLVRAGETKKDGVSIRASLRQRGEPYHVLKGDYVTVFQSAPHFGSEANTYPVRGKTGHSEFQSAPHFGSEANPNPPSPSPCTTVVSIRASLRQRGEPTQEVDINLPPPRFNPRLTSAARRTQWPFFPFPK